MNEIDLTKAIIITAETLGQSLTDGAVRMFVKVLIDYPEKELEDALLKCCQEMKGFRLTPAEIISRIDDGRPGAQEAWGMVPSDEQTTVVWTEEMRTAHGTVQPLMEDPIAARMAFLEVYTKEVGKARTHRRPVKWVISLGTDQNQKETAIREAVEQGKLTAARAAVFLPWGGFVERPPALRDDRAGQKKMTSE